MTIPPRVRRASSIVLMVAGVLTMLLSPAIEAGIAIFVLGALLEVVGLALRRRQPR